MVYMLPSDRYDDIRYALDITLDDEAIPNEIIASPIYQGQAEAWVLSQDANAASRTGVEQQQVYLAIIYMTASLISQGLPQIRQSNMAGHAGTFTFAETPGERTARLALQAGAALTIYLGETVDLAADAPLFITTVSGRRA